MPFRRCECGYVVEDDYEDHTCEVCGEPCCPNCSWQQDFKVFCHRCALMELEIESEPDEDMGYGRRFLAYPCSNCGKLVLEDPALSEDMLCADCR